MSSDSEMSSNYQSSSDPEEEDFVDSEDEDIAVVYDRITPHQDEPLAEDDEKENGEQEEEADVGGLTPAVLEARYEREVSLESWYILFTVILCTQDSFSPLWLYHLSAIAVHVASVYHALKCHGTGEDYLSHWHCSPLNSAIDSWLTNFQRSLFYILQ